MVQIPPDCQDAGKMEKKKYTGMHRQHYSGRHT